MILAMFLFQTFSVLQLAVFLLFFVQGRRIFRPSEALFQDEYSDRGLVLSIFLHSRACCTYSSNVQRSDLYFSVGYSEYPPSHNVSKVRWTDSLSIHWSARRSSDASCPAICPACLDMSQGLKAWPPVCKASLIPIELKIHLLKKETSCLHYVKALWKLVTLEARDH